MKKKTYMRKKQRSVSNWQKLSKRLSDLNLRQYASKLKFDFSKWNIADIKTRLTNFIRWTNQRVKLIPWKSPKLIGGALLLLLVGGGLAIYFNGTTMASYMLVNGEKVGIVNTPEEGNELVTMVLAKRGQNSGLSVKTHDQVTFETQRVKKSALLERAFAEKSLDSKLTSYVEGYELVISQTRLALLSSQEEAQTLLNQYKDYYTKPSETNQVESAEFEEPVITSEVEAQPDEIQTADEVFKKLIEGKVTIQEYVVEQNDSWWLIARKNNMKTKEVLAGNPGMTEDSILQPGQKVNLVTVTPYINVVSTGVASSKEVIPFNVVTKTDSSLASGKTVVKQSGTDGEKIVTYSYVQRNGENVDKQVLNEQITKESVEQVVAQGPARVAVASSSYSRGSGQVSGIAWPLSGRINSYYGYRSGGFHTGIDIGGDTGDPYKAAAAGTVVLSGWDGSYGKCILVDHGNGVMTRYAHSSQLLVSVGDKVSQGQTIGLVGATGNATGPHLHFEIIINGSHVNPLNYLP